MDVVLSLKSMQIWKPLSEKSIPSRSAVLLFFCLVLSFLLSFFFFSFLLCFLGTMTYFHPADSKRIGLVLTFGIQSNLGVPNTRIMNHKLYWGLQCWIVCSREVHLTKWCHGSSSSASWDLCRPEVLWRAWLGHVDFKKCLPLLEIECILQYWIIEFRWITIILCILRTISTTEYYTSADIISIQIIVLEGPNWKPAALGGSAPQRSSASPSHRLAPFFNRGNECVFL